MIKTSGVDREPGVVPAGRRWVVGRRLAFMLWALPLSLAACRTITLKVPEYRSRPAAATGFVAGVGKVDLTPPPGYPMGGHSIAGRVSRGHWMRLSARAFYFRDRSGRSLVLVSCDLFAVPAGLQQRVAWRVNREHPDVSAENLLLAATHTHQGPGNYMTSEVYNGFASPLPGFDEELFDWMSGRIVAAVGEAIADSARTRGPVSLRFHRGELRELVRNRSVRAFEANPEEDRNEVLRHAPPPPSDCPAPCLRYRAVDTGFGVLEIRAGDSSIGAIVFAAFHPTAMAHSTAVYSPDLVGRAMRLLEKSRPAGFVAGFFNGAEGDVSPRWLREDAEETRCFGDRLARSVEDALRSAPNLVEEDPAVDARHEDVPRKSFCGGATPVFGIAAVGGAEDGRAITFDMGWRAPYRSQPLKRRKNIVEFLFGWIWRDPHQGVKQPALDFKSLPFLPVTAILAPPSGFPALVPVALYRLGRLSIAAVPAEMTTTMGYRVRRALRAADPDARVLLVGLANEYLSYVATDAEYQVQDYEGASTLFGPDTGKCYVDRLVALARRPPGASGDRVVAKAAFRAGPVPPLGLRFGPAAWGADPESSDASLFSPFAGSGCLPPTRWPRFEWSDPEEDVRVELLEWTAQRWSVEETDEDSNLLTLLASGTPPLRASIWMVPADHDRRGWHRLRVSTASRTHCSAAFRVMDASSGGDSLLRETSCMEEPR